MDLVYILWSICSPIFMPPPTPLDQQIAELLCEYAISSKGDFHQLLQQYVKDASCCTCDLLFFQGVRRVECPLFHVVLRLFFMMMSSFSSNWVFLYSKGTTTIPTAFNLAVRCLLLICFSQDIVVQKKWSVYNYSLQPP